jgi:hypothetical protein
MLRDGLRHQRGERSHRSFEPFGRCVPPVLEQPWRDAPAGMSVWLHRQ